MSLLDLFLPSLAPALQAQARGLPELEQELRTLLQDARAGAPSVDVGDADFLRFLAERMPRSGDLQRALGATRAADLLLACGALAGRPVALHALDAQVLEASVQALRTDLATADELLQRLRHRLLVGEGGPPKLTEYTGRGALIGWTRMVARRMAIDLFRQQQREGLPAGSLPDAAGSGDPELSLIQLRAREAIRDALRDALQGLPERDRRLMQLHFAQGLSLEQVAQRLEVPKSTAAYWLAQARRAAVERVRQLLADRLKLGSRELDSLIGVARSDIEVSLGDLLR